MGNLAQRYGVEQAPPDPKLKLPAASAPLIAPPPAPVKERPAAKIIAGLREAISVAKNETKPSGEPKPNKGGRPRKREVDPWIAEGISKATWHRRQKAKAG